MRLVLLQKGRDDARLIIGTRLRVYTLRAEHFGGVQRLVEIYQGIRLRMGREAAMRNDMGLAAARRMMARPAYATTALLVGLALTYVVQMQGGGETLGGELALLLQMGALFPPLVNEGEWFRLVSATILHGNLVHLLVNGVALKELGGLVERLVGRERFILIYVGAAIAGSAASVWAGRPVPSVGASGAIFGILGALFAAQLIRGRQIPPGAGQSITWWSVVLGVYFVVLPMLVTQVDHLAHLGGFLAGGAVLGVILLVDSYALAPSVARPWWIRLGAVLFLAIFLAGIFVGARYTRETEWGQDRLLESFATHAEIDLRNELAWYVVVDPGATYRELRAARDVARTNVDEILGDGSIAGRQLAEKQDTLATAHYRLGEHARAISLQHEVVVKAFNAEGTPVPAGASPAFQAQFREAEQAAKAFYVAQLGRFALAKQRKEAKAREGAGVDEVAGISLRETADGIAVTGGEKGLLIATVSAEGVEYGVLLVALGAASPGAHAVVYPLTGTLPPATTLKPLTVLATAEEGWLVGAQFWPTPAEIRGLP